MPPKKQAKRAYKKKAYRKRKPTTNSTKSMSKDNWAKCSSIGTSTTLQTNTAYNFEFALANAPTRVLNVAKAHQEFKIDYVEVRFKPLYDTYSTTAATAGVTAPQLYHQIIKDQSVVDMVNVAQFRQNGLNAMSLAKDGNKVWRYKPAAAAEMAGVAGPVASNMIKVSPWLDTEAITSTPAVPVFSGTAHYGSCLWIDAVEPTPVNIATIEVEIHYIFRKPRSDYVPPNGVTSTQILL